MLYKLMDQRKMLYLQPLFTILWTIWNHRPKWCMRRSPPTHGNYSRLFQTLICKYQEAPYLTFLFYFIYFLLVSILKIWLFSSSSWSFFPTFHLSGTIPNTTVIVILLTRHLSSKLSNSSCKSFDQKVSTWFTCYKRASHLNGLGYS